MPCQIVVILAAYAGVVELVGVLLQRQFPRVVDQLQEDAAYIFERHTGGVFQDLFLLLLRIHSRSTLKPR